MHKLAEGNTAEVFTWDNGRVLKLWRARYPRQQVEYEAMIGREICSSGLAAPEVFDVVEHEGRFGLVYARVPGISLKAWMLSDPDRVQFGSRWLGRLHAEIHAHLATSSLPSHHLRTRHRIETLTELPDTVRGALVARLDGLPEGAVVCHGDFHPDNVIIDGENAVVIDWLDASKGPSVADVARTILVIDGAEKVPEIKRPLIVTSFTMPCLTLSLNCAKEMATLRWVF